MPILGPDIKTSTRLQLTEKKICKLRDVVTYREEHQSKLTHPCLYEESTLLEKASKSTTRYIKISKKLVRYREHSLEAEI